MTEAAAQSFDEASLRLRLQKLDRDERINLEQLERLNARMAEISAAADGVNVAKHELAVARQQLIIERQEIHAALARLTG